MAAVAVVMAGSMALSVTACGGEPDPFEGSTKQEKYTVADASTSISDVTLKINVGDKNNRSISFGYGELLSGTVTLPDGKQYTDSSLKPAWAAFQDMVGCKFEDNWQNDSNKLKNAKESTTGNSQLSAMDIITDGANNVSTYSDDLLDISNYLDEMPNYKAFLKANPIVQLSLTSNTTTGAMYYVPYFDGNNDIEKYELFKINWVQSLLDSADGAGDDGTTFKSHAETKKAKQGDFAGVVSTAASIESFMGQTGSWTTDVLSKDGAKIANGIKVDYDKALAAAKSNAGLGAAYTAAVGAAYTGTSGNIVDIMNAAINAKQGEVKGKDLLAMLKEYIKVAYYAADGTTPFYTQAGYKLSDVFTGYAAAWDVDLYAALGRALVTNPSLLLSGKNGGHIGDANATALADLYLLSQREAKMQRGYDDIAFVGQLYGVRGLESKNLYSYIDKDGNLQDPRQSYGTYDAFKKFNGFWNEGLIVSNPGKTGNGSQSYYSSGTAEALCTYDYVNTQTPGGFQIAGQSSTSYALEEGYNYSPIITPVSKWNDGQAKYMRFTESWRTTKDTGFCVPVANVKENPAKLKAVLKFIDCMFSNDGQILLTYGPKASSATANDGYWYNEEATAAQISAGQYFEYGGKKLYSDVEYSGVYQPKLTEQVYNAYYGQEVNGFKFDGKGVRYLGTKQAEPTTKYEKKGADIPAGTKCIGVNGEDVDAPAKTPADKLGVSGGYLVDYSGNPVGVKGTRMLDKSVSQWTTNSTLNYTNFARYVMGSALPLGNKLQSFEFQLTSKMGRDGALVVDKAMKEGVVLHTENKMTTNPWYTVVPTVLPYTQSQKSELNKTHKDVFLNGQGNIFSNNKNDNTNLLYQIMMVGFDAAKINDVNTFSGLELTGTTSGEQIVNALNAKWGFNVYVGIKQKAWRASKNYFNNNIK